jgi:hypothetical protein
MSDFPARGLRSSRDKSLSDRQTLTGSPATELCVRYGRIRSVHCIRRGCFRRGLKSRQDRNPVRSEVRFENWFQTRNWSPWPGLKQIRWITVFRDCSRSAEVPLSRSKSPIRRTSFGFGRKFRFVSFVPSRTSPIRFEVHFRERTPYSEGRSLCWKDIFDRLFPLSRGTNPV